MPRNANRILLHLLLLLVSLLPLRGFALPQMATDGLSECERSETVMVRLSRTEQGSADCEFCHSGGCEKGQCNMALCGVLHSPGSLPSLAGLVFVLRHVVILPPWPSRRFSHRTEPPLIRPPIAVHS